MLLQTDKDLIPDINEFGCFFMDLLAVPQIELKTNLTADEINTIWAVSVNAGYLIPNGRFFIVGTPIGILNLGFQRLGVYNRTANNVKVENSDGQNWIPGWYSGFDYMFQTNTSGSGVHYRLFDSHSTVIYDPYPGLKLGDWQQKSYYLLGSK